MIYVEGKNIIIGERVKSARVARMLTLKDLAYKMGVSKQLLSKYETGKTNPSIENLEKLSEVLDFPIQFFRKESDNTEENKAIFFRSFAGVSKKMKESLSQNIEFIEEIYNYFSKFIEFPSFNVDKNIVKDYKIGIDSSYIEKVAYDLREYWNLGNGPISNMNRLLEKNGIIVANIELDTHKVDAFSHITESNTPIIVLGSDKESSVRLRMDLAHELWHILVHFSLSKEEIVNNHKVLEDEAKRFAGAFLLPSKEFSEDIYTIDLDSFVYLKKKWKVSIAAMVMRAYQLEIIDEKQKTSLFKKISSRKWRVKEPLDDTIQFEKPQVLKQAVELLLDNDVLSTEELIYNLAFNKREIEKFCSLEKNYLGEENTKRQYLKLIK
ncbi:TPA: ImmA/IrrE family metallo-endopeptidase [Clostridioides difficile]|uniref:XRE family transcriptional regulator n=1 Tax=Clostridioides difficile TaxID=1496 RepID=UPI001C1B7839|nr:XRE family transcriptional regulator [Clostridioides difficile]HBF8443969.1 ImmA/IrrE family metallo-endopeptidase [Clostridioides difficile]HBF9222081.1 ImmA/IrrE family metallo-endopeptidase [Clostridioides difficile]HBG0353082.1 ImmA/IrrE family metallo-endopeptidase [Clostridioides difficile]HBH1439091.1 ImmA/IrrE family metallo-endopeptidase [Clostridioides difficile]